MISSGRPCHGVAICSTHEIMKAYTFNWLIMCSANASSDVLRSLPLLISADMLLATLRLVLLFVVERGRGLSWRRLVTVVLLLTLLLALLGLELFLLTLVVVLVLLLL